MSATENGSVDRAALLQEIAEITFEAGSAGLWVAADELSPARRRAARITLALAAGGYAWWRTEGSRRSDDETDAGGPSLRTLGTAASATLGAASPVVRRLVGPRWLRRLEEVGASHPYRALGRRVALASFAVSAVTRLPDVVRRA